MKAENTGNGDGGDKDIIIFCVFGGLAKLGL